MDKWKPCKEAQPKKNGEYLVTIKFRWADEVDIAVYEGGVWLGIFGDRVIAWQELPKGYKED